MGAKAMIRRALDLSTGRAQVTVHPQGQPTPGLARPSLDAPVMIAMPDDQAMIAEFRSMIDKGQGGARGLSAATRLQALRGLDRLIELDQAHAARLASVITRGERSQGSVVQQMITRGA